MIPAKEQPRGQHFSTVDIWGITVEFYPVFFHNLFDWYGSISNNFAKNLTEDQVGRKVLVALWFLSRPLVPIK